MKKTIKSGIVAAVLIVAGFAAYQSYGVYDTQDNSLLIQNVEALAQGPEPDGDGEGPTYSNASSESECSSESGLWNLRLAPTGQSGVVTVPKNKKITLPLLGEITWPGKTGEVVAWCTYACTAHNNGCCIQNQQGIWVNGKKMS